jgi:diguanylate cyclase (GGDEF)-like protein
LKWTQCPGQFSLEFKLRWFGRDGVVAHSADCLTGLADWTTLVRYLEHAIAVRRPDESVAVLLINLDRFFRVNRELGHAAGDQLLRDVASRLERALCSHFAFDLLGVGGSDIRVARTGSDEFGVALSRICRCDRLLQLVAYLHTHLKEGFREGGSSLYLSSSIGVALCNRDRASAQDLLHQADTALKHAKHSGCCARFAGSLACGIRRVGRRSRSPSISPPCSCPAPTWSSAVFAESVVTMARRLGLPLIAEGIETCSQFDFLQGLQCHGGQGFHLGLPVPAQEFGQRFLAI